MLLVHFIMFWFQKKRFFLFLTGEIKCEMLFCQNNARSDLVGSKRLWTRLVYCAALGFQYDHLGRLIEALKPSDSPFPDLGSR